MATKVKAKKPEKTPKRLPDDVEVEIVKIGKKAYLKALVPIEIKESSTGKSDIIATTGGNLLSDLDFKGRKVFFGCVCYSPVGKDGDE